MINKQKLWFLTLFSLIMILAVYYIALPEASLSRLIDAETTKSDEKSVLTKEEDSLATLRIEDDEKILAQMEDLQKTLLDKEKDSEEKNNAYEKLKSINYNKGKEDALESLILKTFNYKSFIKINNDQINVTVATKDGSYEIANKIITTIQKEFPDKKYITVKFQ